MLFVNINILQNYKNLALVDKIRTRRGGVAYIGSSMLFGGDFDA